MRANCNTSGWHQLVSPETGYIYLYSFCCLLPLDKQEQPILYHDSRQGLKEEQGRGGGYSYKQFTATTACFLSELTDEGTDSVGIVLFLLILICNFGLAKTA